MFGLLTTCGMVTSMLYSGQTVHFWAGVLKNNQLAVLHNTELVSLNLLASLLMVSAEGTGLFGNFIQNLHPVFTHDFLPFMYVLGKQITLHWIPLHMGIAGNEQADMLAKKGTNIKQSKNNNQTYHSAKLQIKNKIQTKQQEEFRNTSANKK